MIQARVYMDRRIAKHAGWVQTRYNRPYIRPIAEKWLPEAAQMINRALKRL